MKVWKKKILDLPIWKKFVLYTYMVLLPVLLVICVFIARSRYMISREDYEDLQRNSVGSLTASLEMIRQDISNFSLNIAIDEQIQGVLSSEEPERLNQDAKMWYHETPVQMLEDIISLKGFIKTISIYPENGVFPYLRCIDYTSYKTDIEQIRETDIYQKAVNDPGNGFWIAVGKGSSDLYLANREEKLVLCRAINNFTKNRRLGFLTVGISEDVIEELCSGYLQDEMDTLILYDRFGNEIISYGYEDEMIRDYIQEEQLLKQGSGHASYKNRELFWEGTESEGWKICRVIPAKNFWDFFKDMVYIPLLLLIAIGFGLLPVLMLVSNVISRPLAKVCQAMEEFRRGNFHQQVEVQTQDEVGKVASCFNQMAVDINALIQKNYIMVLKERESELAILQAQINPHFLYNALDGIYWQAVNADDEETAESIYQLSQLFRLVLGQGKEFVTVEMEAELIQRYLEIQKLRFGHKIDFDVRIQSEMLKEKIPKLILQPFVENAVIHGGEKIDELYRISVMGEMKDNYMEFQIADTGNGMTEEQLQKIWEEDESDVFASQKVGRYAIKNVRARLELRYGKDFRLEIESKEKLGTTVTVRIPAKTEEKDNECKAVDSGG